MEPRPVPLRLRTVEFYTDRHGVIRRAAALKQGYTDAQLHAHVKSGRLLDLGEGAYLLPGALPVGSERGDAHYRMRCIAFGSAGRGAAPVLGHQSAAALHGLKLLKPDLDRVHLFSGRRGGGHMRNRRHVHAGKIDDAETVTVDGIRITSVARTAVDVACCGDFAQALTALDSALRLGATVDQLKAELEARRRTGSAMAARALTFADGDSESVGESWSRAQLILAGLPTPSLQVWYPGRKRRHRVDFDWGGRLIGEFDGLRKYQRDLRPDETVTQAVMREKAREDELRALGAMVIRWIWADLEAGRVVPLVREWITRLQLA